MAGSKKPTTEAGKEILRIIESGAADADLHVIYRAAMRANRDMKTKFPEYQEGETVEIVSQGRYGPKYILGAQCEIEMVHRKWTPDQRKLPYQLKRNQVPLGEISGYLSRILSLTNKPRGAFGNAPRFLPGETIWLEPDMIKPVNREDWNAKHAEIRQQYGLTP